MLVRLVFRFILDVPKFDSIDEAVAKPSRLSSKLQRKRDEVKSRSIPRIKTLFQLAQAFSFSAMACSLLAYCLVVGLVLDPTESLDGTGRWMAVSD